MIIEENFEVSITTRNIEFYRNMGFEVELRDKIIVKSSQLTPHNKNTVKVICNYCGETINRRFQDHYKIENKETFNGKHSCKKCSKFKSEEIAIQFFNGVHPTQTESAKEKRTATNIDKYGGSNPQHSIEVRDKVKNTLLKNYGVDNFFKHESFKEIREETMIDKYGYAYPMQDPDRKEGIIAKMNETLYENGNAPCSTQQLYINDIVKGQVNFPIGRLMLDIAFPREKIYIEYQGSGHDLDVKFGKISQENFNRREMNRYYFLKNKNWKMIEVISTKDDIPKKEKLLEMIELAREILKNTSFIQFNIDNSTVRYNKTTKDYNFEETISYYELHKSIKNETYSQLIV